MSMLIALDPRGIDFAYPAEFERCSGNSRKSLSLLFLTLSFPLLLLFEPQGRVPEAWKAVMLIMPRETGGEQSWQIWCLAV